MGRPVDLAAPTHCRYCAGAVVLVSNSEIYGRPYGNWPWIYLCQGCRAYVGTHPNTTIPLGTLADAATRQARKHAHEYFDPLWRDHGMRRTDAYRWLARAMALPEQDCHIARFNADQCAVVVALCSRQNPKSPVLGLFSAPD